MHSHLSSIQSHAREREILEFVARLLDLDNLDTVLHEVVKVTPRLINNRGVSIYLNPKYVRRYDGNLVENGRHVRRNEIKNRIIVLAAASARRDVSAMIGKYFYRRGEGLTGWVFKQKKELFLDDMSDENEIQKYSGLEWLDKYGGASFHYGTDSTAKKPFLSVPIMVKDYCEGVIRVSTPPDGQSFPDWAKNMFHAFGRAISKRIEIESIIYQQRSSLGRLIRIINRFGRREERRAFSAIVDEAKHIVGGTVCNLYMLDQHAMTVMGVATTDRKIRKERRRNPEKAKSLYKILPGPFSREHRQGLTGWIFRTAKPLILENISTYELEQELSDNDLSAISDSALINNEDRVLQVRKDEIRAFGASSRFLGVPLLTASNKAQGVITIVAPEGSPPYREHHRQLLVGYAHHVSILLTNMKRRKVTDLLINLGQKYGDDLFQDVVREVPELIYARACSIFEKPMEKDRSNDTQGPDLIRLRFTSSANLVMADGGIKPLSYEMGEGKTGFVAKVGRTLVINHYGSGDLDRNNLEKDLKKYQEDPAHAPFNLVRPLKDDLNREVGIARLVRTHNDDPCDREIAQEFKDFVNRIRFKENGLQSNRVECEVPYAWSFLASPLKDAQGNIYGVMRIPRGFPGGIFTDEDVALAMSITNRLCSAMDRVRTLERNLSTLASINSKINTSFNSNNPEAILQSILEAVTDNLGFEFATLQRVDQARKSITTVLTRKNENVPDAWDPRVLKGTSHLLDPGEGQCRDIHAFVLREYRKPYIPPSNDIHFDQKIYIEQDHIKLIRVYVPIIAQNPEIEIGTIEAGYDISRKPVIEDGLVVMLQALANQAAIAIRNQEMRQVLISAERLKILPQYMHIIKSPIIRLSMQLKGIERELDLPDTDLERIKESVRRCKRLGQVINVMSTTFSGLMASEHEQQEYQNTDLAKFLEEVVKEFGFYREHIEIRNKLAYPVILPLTISDCLRMKIIMFNLLMNAVKYSPIGGAVRITTREEKEHFVISVEDEGPGFSPDYLVSGLGQPVASRRHDDWPYGTGLGLYQVCTILKDLGWTCDACNCSEKGAMFSIHIPKSWRTQDGADLQYFDC